MESLSGSGALKEKQSVNSCWTHSFTPVIDSVLPSRKRDNTRRFLELTSTERTA